MEIQSSIRRSGHSHNKDIHQYFESIFNVKNDTFVAGNLDYQRTRRLQPGTNSSY